MGHEVRLVQPGGADDVEPGALGAHAGERAHRPVEALVLLDEPDAQEDRARPGRRRATRGPPRGRPRSAARRWRRAGPDGSRRGSIGTAARNLSRSVSLWKYERVDAAEQRPAGLRPHAAAAGVVVLELVDPDLDLLGPAEGHGEARRRPRRGARGAGAVEERRVPLQDDLVVGRHPAGQRGAEAAGRPGSRGGGGPPRAPGRAPRPRGPRASRCGDGLGRVGRDPVPLGGVGRHHEDAHQTAPSAGERRQQLGRCRRPGRTGTARPASARRPTGSCPGRTPGRPGRAPSAGLGMAGEERPAPPRTRRRRRRRHPPGCVSMW